MTFRGTQLMGFGAGGTGGPASLAFTDNSVTGSGQNPTFSSQSLGTASGDRYIVVGVTGEAGTTTVSSLTVAGVSATNVIVKQQSFTTAEIWIAAVPTGTTGDIVVNWGASQDCTGIGVWAMYSANTTAHDTAFDNSSSTVFSDTLTIPANGVAFACCSKNNTSTATWANLTEDYDENRVAGRPHSGASTSSTTTISPTISCTWTASGTGCMVAASFGPA